jgi:hypothetical protein
LAALLTAAPLHLVPTRGDVAGSWNSAICPARRIQDVVIPDLDPAEVERFDALLTAIEHRRELLRAQDEALTEIRQLAVAGLADGTATIHPPHLPIDPPERRGNSCRPANAPPEARQGTLPVTSTPAEIQRSCGRPRTSCAGRWTPPSTRSSSSAWCSSNTSRPPSSNAALRSRPPHRPPRDPPRRFLEDKDEYTGEASSVPTTARWEYLAENAQSSQEGIGKLLDDAMDALMRDNPALTGVLPKIFNRDNVDQRRLKELVDLIGDARFTGHGDRPAQDVLGEVYERFLEWFARAEGKRAGSSTPPPAL